jgi:hypothetical protein
MKTTILMGLAIILAACSTSPSYTYGNSQTKTEAKWSSTSIEVHWISKADISRICKELGATDSSSDIYSACARSKPNTVNVCEIYTVQPKNFDDTKNLTILGHEAWHCFGATHKSM